MTGDQPVHGRFALAVVALSPSVWPVAGSQCIKQLMIFQQNVGDWSQEVKLQSTAICKMNNRGPFLWLRLSCVQELYRAVLSLGASRVVQVGVGE